MAAGMPAAVTDLVRTETMTDDEIRKEAEKLHIGR